MSRKTVTVAALLAVVCGSMLAAAPSASAVEFLLALWLDNGEPIDSIIPVQFEIEELIENRNAGGVGIIVHVTCSHILDGWVGPESLSHTSEVLSLGGKEVPATPLSGTALLCENVQNCSEPEVWQVKVGDMEVESMVDGTETFFVDLAANTGWYIQCTILGVKTAETCEFAEEAIALTNEAGGVIDGSLSDTFQTLAGLKLANCSIGGIETGEVEGLGTLSGSGLTLTVSS
jgi:hypothetical protein